MNGYIDSALCCVVMYCLQVDDMILCDVNYGLGAFIYQLSGQ